MVLDHKYLRVACLHSAQVVWARPLAEGDPYSLLLGALSPGGPTESQHFRFARFALLASLCLLCFEHVLLCLPVPSDLLPRRHKLGFLPAPPWELEGAVIDLKSGCLGATLSIALAAEGGVISAKPAALRAGASTHQKPTFQCWCSVGGVGTARFCLLLVLDCSCCVCMLCFRQMQDYKQERHHMSHGQNS